MNPNRQSQSAEVAAAHPRRSPGIPVRSLVSGLLLTGCYSLAAGLVILIMLVRPGLNSSGPARVPDMMQGTAHRPFVYRTLLPTTARLVVAVTPPSLKERVAYVVNRDAMLRRTVAWEPPHAFDYVVVIALIFLCLVGYGWTLRALARTAPGVTPLLADFASVLGLIVLPALFRYHVYPYDPPTLLLSALALLALLRRRHGIFYLLLVFFALNKETSVLLTGLFLLRERGALRRSHLAMHAAAQLAISAGIRALLLWRFAKNPGGVVEWHWLDHNRLLALDPGFYLRLAVLVLPIGLMVAYQWLELTRFRGHLTPFGRRYHDGQAEGQDRPHLPTGIPAADGRAGPLRAQPRGSGPGV